MHNIKKFLSFRLNHSTSLYAFYQLEKCTFTKTHSSEIICGLVKLVFLSALVDQANNLGESLALDLDGVHVFSFGSHGTFDFLNSTVHL